MRKLIGTALLAASALVTPSLAVAQMAHAGAKHEFGVDLGIAYSKPSGFDGAFIIGTPVDVRVGFVSAGKMQVEPRFTLLFLSSSGTTNYDFDLGLNILFGMGTGGNRSGPYFTVGGAADIQDFGTSGAQFSVNGGIGTRSAYGSGATRLEAFVNYDLESTKLGNPNTLTIGARVGLSLWH